MMFLRSGFVAQRGLLSLVTLLFSGGLFACAAVQKVNYSVENVPRVTESRIKNVRLVISPLTDDRRGLPDNQVLFSSSNETTLKNESYCINAEADYAPNSVGAQISQMLAAHLHQRSTLGAVSVGARARDAYFLTGHLRRYYGAQKSTSVSTTTTVLFGAIGAGIAAASTPDFTPGVISIEIADLFLYDNVGNPVAKLPDVRYHKKLELRASSSCLIIYENVNDHLKQVFDKYTSTIESALENAIKRSQPPPVANVAPIVQPPKEPW